jgi:hypothetical protein
MLHGQKKLQFGLSQEVFRDKNSGGPIVEAIPPGATGSAVTGTKNSMAGRMCKAQFCKLCEINGSSIDQT